MILSKITSKFNFLLRGISARPPYNDPMNKEGEIPTDVLGSYSGTPLDGSQPVQDADDL